MPGKRRLAECEFRTDGGSASDTCTEPEAEDTDTNNVSGVEHESDRKRPRLQDDGGLEHQHDEINDENNNDQLDPSDQRPAVPLPSDSSGSVNQDGGRGSETTDVEAGVIEKITLINFMCHSHLEVPLGRNVNFIIGKNGSGKSAILTGLAVALGSRANVTNRGNSLKNLIKKGCSSCLVSIQLCNIGEDAFKPKEYGKSIIIERRISRDGAGKYKIKSVDGQAVTNKKEELEHILDQFNIQLDNPVSVLNQDTSRCLLSGSSPTDLYKFFLQATYLLQMSHEYMLVAEGCEVSEGTYKKKEKDLLEVRRQVKELEEKFQDVLQLGQLTDQIEKLKNEYAWALVIEKEKEVAQLASKLEKSRQCLLAHEEKILKCDEFLEKLEEESRQIENQLNAVKEEISTFEKENQALSDEVKEKKKVFLEKQSRRRKNQQEIQDVTSEKEQLRAGIKEIRESQESRDLEEERRIHQETLRQKQEELDEMTTQEVELNEKCNNSHQELREKENELSKLQNDIKSTKRDIHVAYQQLKEVEQGRKNRLAMFGRWAVPLVNKIKEAIQQQKFHRPPKGPLGYFLGLKEERWSIAVETCLGPLGYAFCCHDSHDCKMLKNLMKQTCTNFTPKVIMSRFADQQHCITGNKPQCPYPIVLDMLRVDDPVIANGLIDQGRVESMLLFETGREARNVMWDSPPKHALQGFTLDGEQVYAGRANRSYSKNLSYLRHYLKGNPEEEIRKLHSDVRNRMKRETELKVQQTQLEGIVKEKQLAHQKLSQQRQKLRPQITRLQAEVKELENFEEDEPPDISELESDLQQCTLQIERLTQESQDAESEYSEAKILFEEKQEEKSTQQQKADSLIERTEPLRAQLDNKQIQIVTERDKKQKYEKRRDELLKRVEDEGNNYDKKVKETEMTAENAGSYCTERVETSRKAKDIETEILKKQEQLNKEEISRGNKERVTKEYHKALGQYQIMRKNLKNVKRYCAKMNKALKSRAYEFKRYRHYVSSRTSLHFIMLLSKRGYVGKLLLNHDEETVTLKVNVNPESAGRRPGKSQGTVDTRTLSGGERSFTTVAFVACMWEAMESPFRCLDEFDVFMDLVNRRICIENLLKLALEQRSRQFIFVTPQDMSAIKTGPKVRIFRMEDPEREEHPDAELSRTEL